MSYIFRRNGYTLSRKLIRERNNPKMKYEIGMRFILQPENMVYKLSSYEENYCILTPENILDTDIDYPVKRINENLLPLPMYDDNYTYDMATIGRTTTPIPLLISVNPDPNRIGNPYFKVYDTDKIRKNSSRVMRLHFLDSGMEYHRDEYLEWIPSKADLNNIKNYLQQKNTNFSNYTNWQALCYSWNNEYGFDMQSIHDYLKGIYDKELSNNPSYVPSNALIPETWVYNPPKGKHKKK